jgi:GNAT superfamily N-acetyltransferase
MSDDSGSPAITIRRIPEAEIGGDLAGQLQLILKASFPDYPARTYFKLPPHFRYVAMAGDEVVAQMGVELRVIQVGGAVLRTFGVVDLCVRPGGRSRGLAGRLLAELTGYARECGMDFIILFADDDRVYTRNGWARVSNRCTWVQINEHTTLGIGQESMSDALMVKPTGDQPWPDGDADLLGHVF